MKVLKEKRHEFSKYWVNVNGVYPQMKKRKNVFEREETKYKITDLICEKIEI